ncbi:MAG: tRNA uridine-5-carboxymethylaminomethyl(34) synthesis GTPase MnmE [Rhodospirillaceae bacterium]|nr:tRNA uridine-5-carboxymethylaminomethyl(34) synthesis GTPase MnmE [Rhodospirillaceae bacterium]
MTARTIFALASGHGRAGIAVIRLSGPDAGEALRRLAGPLPPPRVAARASFTDPRTSDLLDQGLALWFPGPHSFTGEDVAELHIHGGRAVIEGILAALASIPGLRSAEPGEFTRRAFEHGKMDLTQAEALADLVDAETAAQARQALRQMGGDLKALYDGWRARLIKALAHLETVIDFPDEDLPADVAARLWTEVKTLAGEIARHLDDGGRGERIRNGLMVAIIGPPNAGKSSLLNMLAGRDAAIVTATPGTTRDVIEVHLDLKGFAVTLADTAGLREAADEIEREGIRRSRLTAEAADLKIAVFDGAAPRDAATTALVDANTLVVINKGDLLPAPPSAGGHVISAKTGAGVTAFLEALAEKVKDKIGAQGGAPLTRARHRQALQECRDALQRACAAQLPELAAEDLRLAARALGRITGRVEVEEILDVVFRDFCIGK